MALFVNILQTVNIMTLVVTQFILQKALSRQVMGLIWFPGPFRHRTLYFMCIQANYSF